MAKAAPAFAKWKSTLGDSTWGVKLKGLSPSEQQSVYKIFVAEFSKSNGDLPQSSAAAVMQFEAFKKNPTPASVPDAIASTPAGKTAIASATSQANAAAGTTAAPKANSFLAGLNDSGGLGNWFPWMDASAVRSDGQGEIDLFGPDANSKQLSDAQITQFRNAWNQANPSRTYADNQHFMSDQNVVQGSGPAQAAFEAAFNTGPSAQANYTLQVGQGRSKLEDVNVQGGFGTRQVSTQAAWVAAANNANGQTGGGTPALGKYMGEILADAQDNRVPWQVLWGVLRARLSAMPNQSTGTGLFNLDPSTAGSITDPLTQISYLAKQLKAGFDQTGDWAFAALYTDNPQSALQLYHTGHSNPGRALKDGQYVASVLGGPASAGGAGTNSVSVFQLGFGQEGQDANYLRPELIQNQAGGTGSNGTSPSITLPDMSLLTQNADAMIRQYFFRAPNPGEAEALAGTMRDAIVQSQQQVTTPGATPEQVIQGGLSAVPKITQKAADPAAAGLAQLQSEPEYQSLYGKEGPLGAADYAQEFKNIEGTMLGDPNADPTALREGMQGGNPDQFAGFLAGNEMGNASFRQRLYQVGQSMAGV